MLFGSLATGTCYLIAAICLKMADRHPEDKYPVREILSVMMEKKKKKKLTLSSWVLLQRPCSSCITCCMGSPSPR